MNDFKGILDGILNKFVCDDGGVYRGQCPQLPKYAVRACGGDWPGATGNGNNLVDRLVQIGGYYGESSRGYRICSCDVAGSQWGHTWIEINVNGKWVIYEQNAGRSGVATANFGCGTVYAVSTTNNRGSWRLNVRYAAHPAIDAWIDKHTPKPEPKPAGFKVGDKVVPTRLVDYTGTPLVQYDDYYTIMQINGDRAVLTADRNGQPVVWAAMNTKDIKKA